LCLGNEGRANGGSKEISGKIDGSGEGILDRETRAFMLWLIAGTEQTPENKISESRRGVTQKGL